jgi:hypothetical protein
VLDCRRRRGHWLADEPELGQANSLEPDLVTDEMDGRGPIAADTSVPTATNEERTTARVAESV